MSWIAFELLLLALGWLGVGFFKAYIEQKESQPEISQGGGIIFGLLWFGLFCVLIYQKMIVPSYLLVFGPIIFMSIIGFLEDCHRISSRVRLVFQVIAIYTSFYFMNVDISYLKLMGWNIGSLALRSMPDWSFLSLIVFSIVGLCSVWDRMDKTDGFAATQSLFVLGTGGFILSFAGAYSLAILLFGLCALIFGFLIWNWPLAKIIMGKSGTLFLGSLISILALSSYQFYGVPLEIWIILMSPFLVDATLTAIRRGIAAIFSPLDFIESRDNHAYQRLLVLGCSPFQLLCGLIALNSLLVVLAFWAYSTPALLIPITVSSIGLAFIVYAFIEYSKPMYRSWYGILAKKLKPQISH